MNNLPCAKKFNCIATSYPVLNHVCRSAVTLLGRSHVGKRDIILLFKIENCNRCILNDNFRHRVYALVFSRKGSYNLRDDLLPNE